MGVTAEQLLAFAAPLEGEQWTTLVRPVPFRYLVTADRIEFISESGAVHPAPRAEVAAFCDEFNRSGSFTPGDYSSAIDCPWIWYKSYLLALIQRFVREQSSRATMTDIEKARRLFREAGLAFPTIPEGLAVQLKEQSRWLFSTREIDMSPYNLQHYVHEVDGTDVEDYAVLSHSGHGANSYAIQYYLVYGPLRMFLHLGWGGVYMDADAAAGNIRQCFSLADQIVPAAMTVGRLGAGDRLTVVGADFYGSYWLAPEQSRQKESRDSKGPAEILAEVLHWLTSPQKGNN
jgi:hypothetical protein